MARLPNDLICLKRRAGVSRRFCLYRLVSPGLLILALVMSLGAGPASVQAANPAEDVAFNSAARSFKDGFFEQADKGFGEFIARYPASERIPEAMLLQAQARSKLGQYEAVIKFLAANFSRAGKLADQYRYWMAEAYYQSGDYAAAESMYGQLIRDYPESFRLSDASYGQAMAWFKLGRLDKTIELLRDPAGTFQKAARALPEGEFVVRGYLLLGQVLLQQRQYPAAEETLANLARDRTLPPGLEWERQYLLVRAQLEAQRTEAALKGLARLTNAATATGSPTNVAEAILLEGQVLQAAQRPEEAAQLLQQSVPALPSPQRKLALLQLVELNLGSTNAPRAIQNLEALANAYPQDADLDHVRLALGELRLQEYHLRRQAAGSLNSLPPEAPARLALYQTLTNSLYQARTNFEQLVAGSPKSALLGLAQLDRGWCYWELAHLSAGLASGESGAEPERLASTNLNLLNESLLAFKTATEALPPGTNLCLARFKWAEAQSEFKDYGGAAQNYRRVVEEAARLPTFPSGLLEQTLYKLVVACGSLEPPDMAGAEDALDKLTRRFPKSELGDRSYLLVGQLLNRQGDPEGARRKYAELVRQFPASELRPEVDRAVARTYLNVNQPDWTNAIHHYETWIARYTNSSALPEVAFDLAWVNDQAGRETNAFQLFTNYVARFPASPLAPAAQYWVGDYFFNLGGTNYGEAEKNYARVWATNWPVSELTYRARLAAGRAAFARQGWNNATNYFIDLINLLNSDTNSSPVLLAQAYLALGDTFMAMAPDETNTVNRLKRFEIAINAFAQVSHLVAETNRLAPLAAGRIGDCHAMLLSQDPARFEPATNFYSMVITSLVANLTARSDAEVGLAVVLKAQATANKTPADRTLLLKLAEEHLLNVVYGKRLRASEKPDAFWLAKAGLEAADLLEAQGRWRDAVSLYERLLASLPLSSTRHLQKRLEAAKSHISP